MTIMIKRKLAKVQTPWKEKENERRKNFLSRFIRGAQVIHIISSHFFYYFYLFSFIDTRQSCVEVPWFMIDVEQIYYPSFASLSMLLSQLECRYNYCIVLYCIVLYCIVLYCIVLYCIVLYCIVWYVVLTWQNTIWYGRHCWMCLHVSWTRCSSHEHWWAHKQNGRPSWYVRNSYDYLCSLIYLTSCDVRVQSAFYAWLEVF